MKLSIKKEVQVEAKTIQIFCKVRDNFTASILDQDNDTIFEQEDGYVWDIMPGDHFGDYVILNIDIETGQITNWEKPTVPEVQKLISCDEE